MNGTGKSARREELGNCREKIKNMDAFFAWEKKLLYQKAYDESYGFPPFLLLQKARMVKDTAMVRYLSLADFDETSREEGADDEARKKKADAYLEWLPDLLSHAGDSQETIDGLFRLGIYYNKDCLVS